MNLEQDQLTLALEEALSRLLAPVAELESLKRKEFLTEEEAAKLFSLSAATLKTKRCRGGGPSYIKDGVRILYSRKGLQAYLDARRVKTSEQP